MKTFLLATLVSVVLSAMTFLAIVGALFLWNVEHDGQTTEYCPRIVRYEDDTLVCIVPMQAEDDNLMIMRGEQNK